MPNVVSTYAQEDDFEEIRQKIKIQKSSDVKNSMGTKSRQKKQLPLEFWSSVAARNYKRYGTGCDYLPFA